MAQLALGPFRLESPIARGGMSEVWRAQSRGAAFPVAIKLLPRGVDDPTARAAFEREVRAMARLDHPGIIRVVDQGRITTELQIASRGRFREGAPWMAMEHAGGGTLQTLSPLPDWATTRSVLLSTLDALAHAHARSLIHRDIKPRNLLLCTAADERPGLKLSDFGIAHALGQDGGRMRGAGTLSYMAPEQLRGEWRDIGPWTDLYSLGCTAWTLMTGRPLFIGREGPDRVRAALSEPLPDFECSFPIPFGMTAWLHCLLAREPSDRFKRAADAAAALLALPSSGATPVLAPRRAEERHARGPVLLADATTLTVEGEGAGLAGERAYWRPTALAAARSGVPEIPVTWRHPIPRAPSLAPHGAGLGLMGARELRLVGRDQELDRAWEIVRRVGVGMRSEVVVVRGTAGVGRTRFVTALAQRGHELGVASVFHAGHTPGDRGGSALWRMLDTQFGTEGLARDQVVGRVVRRLGRGRDAQVVIDHVGLDAEEDLAAGERERGGVVLRAIDLLAENRLPIVILDEAHCDPESLRWCADLLDRPGDTDPGLMVLVTVRDDLIGHPEVARPLERILEHARGHELPLGNLHPGAIQGLLRELLGLDASAAARVADVAQGNPQVAVEVVRGWGAQGLLTMGEHGFRVQPGVEARLPRSVAEMWSHRAIDAVRELPLTAGVWLERAAVLGARVEREAWKLACGEPGLVLQAIEEELVALRLASTTPTGWRFRHAGLREALLAMAEEDGRLEAHHRACAVALIDRGDPADEASIGLHLLRSGDLEGAIDRLLAGSERPGNQYDGLELVTRAEEAMRAAGVPEGDARWGRAWVRRAALCIMAGRYGEARDWADKALRLGDGPGMLPVKVGGLVQLAEVALFDDDPEGPELAEQALELARMLGDSHWVNRAMYQRAAAAMARRDWHAAQERSAEVLEAFRLSGDQVGVGSCLRDLGNIALQLGDFGLAARRYAQAAEIFEEQGALIGLAHVYNGLGDVAREEGRLDDAESHYRTALEHFERMGAGQAVLARLNLGLTLVSMRRWIEAKHMLESTRAWMVEQGRDLWVGVASLVLMAAYAGLKDWIAYDRAAEDAVRLLGATDYAHGDLVRVSEDIAVVCRAAGEAGRAALAEQIGTQQTLRLGA